MRVLVVDDEKPVRDALSRALRSEGYAVELASSGGDALGLLAHTSIDAIVLDVGLPGLDGLETCRLIRAKGDAVPVLMLTARSGISDRVAGLDAGADDYLSKGYHFPELLARVRALLRRGPVLAPAELSVEDLVVDTRTRRVTRAGRAVQLTSKEFALLEHLLRREGHVVGRHDIAEHVWEAGFDPLSNLIEVYIQRLRRKIDDGHAVKLIQTRRGAGYLLTADQAGDDV